MKEVKCDGCYPSTQRYPWWEFKRELSWEEATILLQDHGVIGEDEVLDDLEGGSGDRWILNKGFVLFNLREAVYVHDFKYWLIERNGWEELESRAGIKLKP